MIEIVGLAFIGGGVILVAALVGKAISQYTG